MSPRFRDLTATVCRSYRCHNLVYKELEYQPLDTDVFKAGRDLEMHTVDNDG